MFLYEYHCISILEVVSVNVLFRPSCMQTLRDGSCFRARLSQTIAYSLNFLVELGEVGRHGMYVKFNDFYVRSHSWLVIIVILIVEAAFTLNRIWARRR